MRERRHGTRPEAKHREALCGRGEAHLRGEMGGDGERGGETGGEEHLIDDKRPARSPLVPSPLGCGADHVGQRPLSVADPRPVVQCDAADGAGGDGGGGGRGGCVRGKPFEERLEKEGLACGEEHADVRGGKAVRSSVQ